MPLTSPEASCAAPMHATPPLGLEEFDAFRQVIVDSCGIQIGEGKRLLLQNRIGKRLRALGLTSFRAYHDHPKKIGYHRDELEFLWCEVTTNQTHFFREPHHFEILTGAVLPRLAARPQPSAGLRVWSAGCSTGQEVYTLAMVLHTFLAGPEQAAFSVLGSDLDTRVLRTASAGRYPSKLRKEIPNRYLLKYFDSVDNELRVKGHLREHASFERCNFSSVEPARKKFDVIFCRNAMMYLHKATRQRLVQVFYDSLTPGGFLFVGSSESIHGLRHPFETVRMGKTPVFEKPLSKGLRRG